MAPGEAVTGERTAAGRRIVCVSGLGGSADEWTGVASRLARHGEVVAIELPPGDHGGGLRDAVEALRDRLGPAPCVLIGHSAGGVVSLLAAAGASDRLAGLVLSSPFVPLGRDGRSTAVTVADYARHRVLYLAGLARRRRPPLGPSTSKAGDPPSANSRRSRRRRLRALARYGVHPAAFHAMADRVSCPVLLVHGAQDHHVPPAFARAAAARHPAWAAAALPGAGHFPHRDAPAAWLAAVEPWLERLDTAHVSSAMPSTCGSKLPDHDAQ